MSGASLKVASETKPTQRRARGWAREARDAEWLRLHKQGWTVAEIAKTSNSGGRNVERGLARARTAEASRIEEIASEGGSQTRDEAEPQIPWWLELVPLFPINAFTPNSQCRHRGPIPPGSLDCCMVCSASGVDDHPALQRDPRTDPRPEPRPSRGSRSRSRHRRSA